MILFFFQNVFRSFLIFFMEICISFHVFFIHSFIHSLFWYPSFFLSFYLLSLHKTSRFSTHPGFLFVPFDPIDFFQHIHHLDSPYRSFIAKSNLTCCYLIIFFQSFKELPSTGFQICTICILFYISMLRTFLPLSHKFS